MNDSGTTLALILLILLAMAWTSGRLQKILVVVFGS